MTLEIDVTRFAGSPEFVDWLRANGIEAADVPTASTVVVYDGMDGGRFFDHDRYVRDADGQIVTELDTPLRTREQAVLRVEVPEELTR